MNIVITGATSGIGRQLAIDYHNQGHRVWALGRNKQELNTLQQKGLSTDRLDITDREAVLHWFSAMDNIDLLICNAGNCEYIDLPAFDSALIERIMRINVNSVAFCIEAALPLLRNSDSPHLAVMGSSSAWLPLPRAEAYGASKAAVAYMVKTLAIELRREEIAVSLISPGFVATPLTERNDFPMPFLVSVERASRYIRDGLAKKRPEIHFPKRFTLPLKALSLLPDALWRKIAERMVRV